MGVRHRLTALAGVAVAAALALGCQSCKSKPPPVDQPPPPPVDRLAPGELPIGKDKAFALPLPVSSPVLQSYGGSYFVRSSYSPEQIANFVRIHVKGGRVVAGTSSTTFSDVVVPNEPARHLDIDVRPASPLSGYRTELRVHDVTPAVAEPGLTDEERWKKMGMTPDGRILDPKHLQ